MSRLLFVMPEPGYLRMYAETIRALGTRGHEVVLAYDHPLKRGADAPDPSRDSAHVTNVGAVPQHAGPWRDFLIELGTTTDYIRFLSATEGSDYLRSRMDKYLPPRAAALRDHSTWPDWMMHLASAVSRLVERSVPVDPALVRFVEAQRPDTLVITPLVLRGPGGAQQTQLVKAAQALGIPVVLAVGSWDHLSSKGLIRVELDRVVVWNDIQKHEAVAMHGIAADRVMTTGAQPFDQWFGRTPSMTRDVFCARVGLPSERPMVLYAGSSRGIADPELEIAFVRRWIAALRSSPDPVVRTLSILVRPHLSNMKWWADVDLSNEPGVVIWPRKRPGMPMNEVEAADYFHSLYHSAAVLGINTSAMIEATIVGRPVLTIQASEFAQTQAGTRHFHYLVPDGGGPVESASDFDEHLEQLSAAVARPELGAERRKTFINTFVRPHGRERSALDHVVSALEGLTTAPGSRRSGTPIWLAPVRWLAGIARVPAMPPGS